MRILHLGKYYHPYRGGMETVLRHLAEGQASRGHQVRVLVADAPGHAAETAPAAGVTVVRAGTWGTWNSQPVAPAFAGLLRGELSGHRPDLVCLHLPNPLAAAAWLVAGGGGNPPPLGIWHHADITRQRLGRRLARPLQRRCLAAAAGVAVSSRALAAGSRELGEWAGRADVIPFGIPLAPWDTVVPRRDGPFLFVGRLVRYKGLGVLLQAVARVPDAELELVGLGPERRQLERAARSLGVTGRVRFRGTLDDGDLLQVMGRARALVLPSLDLSETFGLVRLEAMAAGLPVVASDLPTGIREVGDEGPSHLFVPPGDPAALAAALARLLETPDLVRTMGEAARAGAASFTREHMIDGMDRWCRRLVSAAAEG